MSQTEFDKEHPTFKQRLYLIIFGTETRIGKIFDIVLLWAIVLSVLSVMLESVKELNDRFGDIFSVLEWSFTILFTIEYSLRILISEKPKKYAFSFFGVVDLLALLPTYLTLIVAGGSYLMVIRTIRLLRIMRILKLSRYLREASVLGDALKASRHKIFVFIGSVFTLVMIVGTLMYIVESGENSTFTSIPRGIYWAIVTVTTVGYGDISPQTTMGQGLASILMLMGYAIIAVPTGIVTSEIATAERDKKLSESNDKGCDLCGNTVHDHDAEYCKKCGNMI
ncbi:MAG: ion transporter [Cyclobacteriaceae bacterium]